MTKKMGSFSQLSLGRIFRLIHAMLPSMLKETNLQLFILKMGRTDLSFR